MEIFCRISETFFVSYFLAKHFFPMRCFWTRTMQIHQTCQKNLSKVLQISRSKVKITKHKKHSFANVAFAINSLNMWNNSFLTVPEVILRNTKSFSIKIWKWTLNFYFVYTLSFSSHNVSRWVEINPDNDLRLFLDLCCENVT